jgi:hypothetical protein
MPAPILQSIILAEKVYQDIKSKNYVIAGIFSSYLHFQAELTESPSGEKTPVPTAFRRLPYPTQAASPVLFLAITECHGKTKVEVQYVNRKTQAVLYNWFAEIDSKDPLELVHLPIDLPLLKVEKDGLFGFDVFGNGDFIGSLKFKTDIISVAAPEGVQS